MKTSNRARTVPRRVKSVRDSGRVLEKRPNFETSILLPEERGFEPRVARSLNLKVRGNSIKFLRKPTLLPGGIIVHEGALHASTFRLEDFSQSTRYIRRRLKNGSPEYVIPKDWVTSESLEAEAIFLDSEYVDEYGHFLMETLSRLWPLIEDPAWTRLPIVTSAKNLTFINFFYERLGFSSPTVIRLSQATKLKKLWIFSQSFVIGKGFTPESASLYSRIAASGRNANKQTPQRVYLSRRGLNTRTGRWLINEAEVETALAKKGFEVIAPQTLGLPQQIDLYANCETLAGQTGTAMYNRLFQPPDSLGILLGASNYILNEHAYTTEMMGLPKDVVVNGRTLDPQKSPQSANWEIDVDTVISSLPT